MKALSDLDMIHAVSLWPRLADLFAAPSQSATKGIAELAMALHYIRRDMPGAVVDDAALGAVEQALAARIMADDWLRLSGNGFLLQQCATPYVFLRGRVPFSAFHEGIIGDLIESDRSVRESTPYRRLERQWILHKLGQGALPDWADAPILVDAAAAYAFNRDLSYAFTHTVFFCTDFAGICRPDPVIKGTAMLIAAQSHAVSDVDLFLECCICLMSQDLDPAELSGLLHLIADICTRHAVLFAARVLEDEYHPLFVYDILRGLMLRRHGVDIATLSQTQGAGPYAALLALGQALCGKDAEAIIRALARVESGALSRDWLRGLARDRLGCLASLARHGALFERELTVLNRRDERIYPAYAETVGGLLADLG